MVRAASEVRQRPDERWNWAALLELLPRLELLNGRRCFGYAVMTETANGKSVPVALALVVEKFRLLESEDPGTFLWFAASAPTNALAALTLPRLDELGRVLTDVTIATSFNTGQGGRIGLHADPNGGDHLVAFYRDRCGLKAVSRDQTLNGIRRNDGRYFYTDEPLASQLAGTMDNWR